MSNNWQDGLILSSFGGFYTVLSQEKEHKCQLRGKLKKKRFSDDGLSGVFVGDKIQFSLATDGESYGMIEALYPRQNFLPRPKIANIEQAIIVMAAKEPDYDLLLLEKILITTAFLGIKAAICINKIDLADHDLNPILEPYQKAGWPITLVSTYTDQGINQFKKLLTGKISVLAGPSGVGKSSILNAILPEANIAVNAISDRLQRGKHTTRSVSLLPLAEGGFVADAPGFSLLDLPLALKKDDLSDYYPEYKALGEQCRFLGCNHQNEPDCAVKLAVEKGELALSRYQYYLRFLAEIAEREIKY